VTADAAPSAARGLLLSAYVTSLVRPDAPIPGPPRPEVALIGRSNVGKSSLLNCLVGRRALARTSRTPGKTRALNVFTWGETLYLVDVPGYGWARAGQQDRAAWRTLVEGYLATRPQLLLLDEIAGGLTEHEARELVALIREIKATGTTMVGITV
jgi:ribosome biogenesis GTP-binding protein YsxC/EngB